MRRGGSVLSRELYFIPSKVDLNDIREEKDGILFLLNENDRNTLIDLMSNPAIPDGHYSKNKQLKNMLSEAGKQLDFNGYDVVKLNGEIYLVYKGVQEAKHVGSGGEGVVKATQNLRTGSWDGALKIFSELHTPEKGETPIVTKGRLLDEREGNVKKEYESLQAEGAAIGLLPRRKGVSRKGIQDAIMMRFARGEDLFDLKNRYKNPSNAKLPISEWLDIIIQMCEIVQNLHNQNKVHRDLKIENFRYDPSSKKVTLVDFSGIKTLDDHGEVYDALMLGTPGYLASEVLSSNIYTAKSDNFALGVTIADMFDMLDEESFNINTLRQKDPYELLSEEEITNNAHSLVTEEKKSFLTVLHEICSELMADVHARPANLDVIIDDLKGIKTQITETLTVGILNIADFRKASILDKYEMLDYFKRFNEVVFIDTDLNASVKDHVILQRELAKYNVIVRDKVFFGEIKQVTEEVKNKFSSESEFVKREFHVLADMSIFDKAISTAEWDPEKMLPDEKEILLEKVHRVLIEFSSTDIKQATATELEAMQLVLNTYEGNAALIEAVQGKIDNLKIKNLITDIPEPKQNQEVQSVTQKFITILAKIDAYKADKLGGRIHNSRSDLEENIQKLDEILEQLIEIKGAFTADLSVANKKYLELCAANINFVSHEIVSLTPQIGSVDLDSKASKKEDRTENLLDELDSIAESLQAERTAQNNAEKATQLRSAAKKALSEVMDPANDINATLPIYKQILDKLEAIAVNKRLPDDVMLLADLAKNAATLAEQHEQQAGSALETAALLLDKAKYYLPLKTYKSSPNLIFSCIEKIADAYEEVCAYYLRRGDEGKIQYWSNAVLEFLTDVSTNLPSEVQERVESLKNQFLIMHRLDIDVMKVIPEEKNAEITSKPIESSVPDIAKESVPIFEKIIATLNEPNISAAHFEAAVRQLNLIPESERTIEYYSTFLKVTNAYSKYSLNHNDTKSAKKNLELAVNNTQSILPGTDMLAISSLYMRGDANQTTEYLANLAISYHNLATIAFRKNDYNAAINYFDQTTKVLTNISEDTLSEERKTRIEKFLTVIKQRVKECIDAIADNAILVGKQMAAANMGVSIPVADVIQSQTTIITANGVMRTEVVQVEEPGLQRKMEQPETPQLINDALPMPDSELVSSAAMARIEPRTLSLEDGIAERDQLEKEHQKHKDYKNKEALNLAQQSPDNANFKKSRVDDLQPISLLQMAPQPEPLPAVSPVIENPVVPPEPVKEMIDEKLLAKLQELLPLFERMANQYSQYESNSGLKGFRFRTYDDMRNKISEIINLAQQKDPAEVSLKLKELNESINALFKDERASIRKHIHFNAAKLFFAKLTKSPSTLEKCLTELKTALDSTEPHSRPSFRRK